MHFLLIFTIAQKILHNVLDNPHTNVKKSHSSGWRKCHSTQGPFRHINLHWPNGSPMSR